MNPFSRGGMRKSAGGGGKGWEIAGWILVLGIAAAVLQLVFGK